MWSSLSCLGDNGKEGNLPIEAVSVPVTILKSRVEEPHIVQVGQSYSIIMISASKVLNKLFI